MSETLIYDFARDGRIGWGFIEGSIGLGLTVFLLDIFLDLFDGDSRYSLTVPVLPFIAACTITAVAAGEYRRVLELPRQSIAGALVQRDEVVRGSRGRVYRVSYYSVSDVPLNYLPGIKNGLSGLAGREMIIRYATCQQKNRCIISIELING